MFHNGESRVCTLCGIGFSLFEWFSAALLEGDVIPYQAETANCINAAVYLRRLALILRAKELHQKVQ
jgi:hypothetical protein